MRGYVAERLGPGYLPELYGVVDWPEQLLDLDLPPRYVVKATHGERDDRRSHRRQRGRARGDRGPGAQMARPRYWRKNGEWGYRGIQPRLIIEEFLDAGGGACRRTGSGSASAGAPRWSRWTSIGSPGTPAASMIPRAGPSCSACTIRRGRRSRSPRAFRGCERWPRRSAKGFDFVRVDLYALGDRIVVGELTHYPEGGNKSFDPPEWDARLGALWPRLGRRDSERGNAREQVRCPRPS